MGDNVLVVVTKMLSSAICLKRRFYAELPMRVLKITLKDENFNEVELQDASEFRDIERRIPKDSRTAKRVNKMFNISGYRSEKIATYKR